MILGRVAADRCGVVRGDRGIHLWTNRSTVPMAAAAGCNDNDVRGSDLDSLETALMKSRVTRRAWAQGTCCQRKRSRSRPGKKRAARVQRMRLRKSRSDPGDEGRSRRASARGRRSGIGAEPGVEQRVVGLLRPPRDRQPPGRGPSRAAPGPGGGERVGPRCSRTTRNSGRPPRHRPRRAAPRAQRYAGISAATIHARADSGCRCSTAAAARSPAFEIEI